MQDCCLRLQLAGKRKSTQLLCLAAILLLFIVNAALYSRTVMQAEKVERLKMELLKPPAKRVVDSQQNLQVNAPLEAPPPLLKRAVESENIAESAAAQLRASAAPDMMALDRALLDALSNMASVCSSTTTCYPHCDTPAAPTQSRIDAAARFQEVRD